MIKYPLAENTESKKTIETEEKTDSDKLDKDNSESSLSFTNTDYAVKCRRHRK